MAGIDIGRAADADVTVSGVQTRLRRLGVPPRRNPTAKPNQTQVRAALGQHRTLPTAAQTLGVNGSWLAAEAQRLRATPQLRSSRRPPRPPPSGRPQAPAWRALPHPGQRHRLLAPKPSANPEPEAAAPATANRARSRYTIRPFRRPGGCSCENRAPASPVTKRWKTRARPAPTSPR